MFKQGREPFVSHSEGSENFSDAEILDEMTTHRGELKLRTVSFKEERLHQVYISLNFHFICDIPLPVHQPYA